MANIKRNLAYNFLLSCSQLLLPLLSIPYVSRVLDPAGIGQVGFIDSFTFYFVIIAEFGITTYGIREIAKRTDDPAKLRILVPQLLTLHVISSAITAAFYIAAVILLWQRIGDVRLILFSASFFVVNFLSCEWYFMGREQFGYIALRSVIVRLLGMASIFLLIHRPADYYLYYAVIAGSAILTSLWNNVVMFRSIEFSFRKVAWQQHLKYVWVTYLISLIYSVPLILDNVILGLVSGAAVVGLYAFSVKVVRIGSTILTDSFLVFFPRIVSLSNEMKLDQLQQKLSLNIQFIILLSIPMGLGLFLVSHEVAAVFFGNKFLSTALNLRILSVFPLLKGMSLFLSNPVLIAHHKEKVYLRNLVLSSFTFVVLAFWLGHRYQSAGACAALVISELILFLLNMFSVKKHFNYVLFSWVVFGQALLAALVFIPVTWLFRLRVTNDTLRLFLVIVTCILLYALALLLMKNAFVRQIIRVARGKFVNLDKPTR